MGARPGWCRGAGGSYCFLSGSVEAVTGVCFVSVSLGYFWLGFFEVLVFLVSVLLVPCTRGPVGAGDEGECGVLPLKGGVPRER